MIGFKVEWLHNIPPLMSYYDARHCEYDDEDDTTQLFKKPESFTALDESDYCFQGTISPYRFVDFDYLESPPPSPQENQHDQNNIYYPLQKPPLLPIDTYIGAHPFLTELDLSEEEEKDEKEEDEDEEESDYDQLFWIVMDHPDTRRLIYEQEKLRRCLNKLSAVDDKTKSDISSKLENQVREHLKSIKESVKRNRDGGENSQENDVDVTICSKKCKNSK